MRSRLVVQIAGRVCVTLIRVSIEETIERVFVCCPGVVQLVKECWANSKNIPSHGPTSLQKDRFELMVLLLYRLIGQLLQPFHVGQIQTLTCFANSGELSGKSLSSVTDCA